jgi:conflict system pore-forming effector with SLATT domain
MFQITLLDHLRLSFGGVVHGYRAHAEIADRLTRRVWMFRIGELALLGGALAANIVALVRSDPRYAVLSAMLIGLALAVFAIYVAVSLESRIYAHRWCASRLWLIREKYRALLSEMRDGTLTLDDVRERRDALATEIHSITEHAPMVDRPTYLSARQALSAAADTALTDEEIDAFLPQSLRKLATVPPTRQAS